MRQPGLPRGSRRPNLVLNSALAMGLVLGVITSFPPVPAVGTRSVPEVGSSENSSALQLAIDPSSWWMLDGNSTPLYATWIGAPPECALQPVWFHWAVAGLPVEGSVYPLTGPTVNFTADSSETGTAEIEVQSAAALGCGGSSSLVERTAESVFTVVVPLTIENLSVGPNPIPAGNLANLTGSVWGGEPPYQLRINWGDGSATETALSGAGVFSVTHSFEAGSFVPSLLVTDSSGLIATATVEEALSASAGLAVGIDPTTYLAEVGVPVLLSGEIVHPPPLYGSLAACTDAASDVPTPAGDPVASQEFTCTFAAPGVADVYFEVIPEGQGIPAVTAELFERVVAPLALNVSAPLQAGEVGTPAFLSVDVTGGVPPLVLDWHLLGTPTAQRLPLESDGAVVVPILPASAGSYVVSAWVSDSEGVVSANTTVRFSAQPTLNVSVSADGRTTSQNAVATVAGTVSAGWGPFLWVVVPGFAPSNESVPNGTLPSVGAFAWSGVFEEEGNLSVTIGIVDRAGVTWFSQLTVPLISPFEARAQLGPSVPGETSGLSLNLSISGGLPPFSIWVNASDGAGWNLSVPHDGVYAWLLPSTEAGTVNVSLVVVDRLGITYSQNRSVVLPQAPSPPPGRPATVSGSNDPSTEAVGLAALLLALAAVAAFLWSRRRKPREGPKPGPDPVATIRRIIEPADGAERATVELLAEEEGIPLATVRATIDRLIADGRLRSDTETDGEEVLAWSGQDER